MSRVDELPPLREVIAKFDLGARKALGQNFLLDLNLTGRIARSAGDLSGVTVIEIGPGPGGLTRALLNSDAAAVVAVERDSRCIVALADLVEASEGRLRLIEGDALEVDPETVAPAPRAIVANLPYNVATPLLIGWLKRIEQFRSLTLMFQREVADRLSAKPGTKAYGRLSVISQWRGGGGSSDVQPAGPSLHAAAEDPIDGRPVDPASGAGTGRVLRYGSGDGGGVRPAPQDAASQLEVARQHRGADRRGWADPDPTGGGGPGGRLRGAGKGLAGLQEPAESVGWV